MRVFRPYFYSRPRVRHIASVLGLIFVIFSGAAQSAGQSSNKNALPLNMLHSYQTECASCHIAYPPGMLPKQSWVNLMKGLESHYGADASLDTATIKEISIWLDSHAGTYKRVDAAPADDRITQSAWFVRKHREISPEVWLRPSIKSPANCAACHTQAEQGDYRERNITIPKQ